MNCCDYNCDQGRNCPARVAKVHRRSPAAEPLPPSHWRETLADLARALALVLVSVFVGSALAGFVWGCLK